MMNELYHYGVKGQRWGVRRYQNQDGTYTEAGKKRYRNIQDEYGHDSEKARIDIERTSFDKGGTPISKNAKQLQKEYVREYSRFARRNTPNNIKEKEIAQKEANKRYKEAQYHGTRKEVRKARKEAEKAQQELLWTILRTPSKQLKSDLNNELKEGQRIANKYRDKAASVILKDLGYNDTADARKWLDDNGLLPMDDDIRDWNEYF